MRYHILATDYDGTLAKHGQVSPETLKALQKFKSTGRKLVLVTGRELDDLKIVFPAYNIFDYIVAENGALIHYVETGKEVLLGPAPDAAFVEALRSRGVTPLSVGKVIVATWEPHENTVLDIIKESGIERQVIFNKGAVMILPGGINKAKGLEALLDSLHLSIHNTVAVGDAENDGAMLQMAECAVAVSNALPSLQELADFVAVSDHGKGVSELMSMITGNDLANVTGKLNRHNLHLGDTQTMSLST